MLFQQDGAPSLCERCARDYLDATLPNNWSWVGGGVVRRFVVHETPGIFENVRQTTTRLCREAYLPMATVSNTSCKVFMPHYIFIIVF